MKVFLTAEQAARVANECDAREADSAIVEEGPRGSLLVDIKDDQYRTVDTLTVERDGEVS